MRGNGSGLPAGELSACRPFYLKEIDTKAAKTLQDSNWALLKRPALSPT
jgi:hypothetical protein